MNNCAHHFSALSLPLRPIEYLELAERYDRYCSGGEQVRSFVARWLIHNIDLTLGELSESELGDVVCEAAILLRELKDRRLHSRETDYST